MRVLITGASGLIGSVLRPALTDAGHGVLSLTRRAPRDAHEIVWDPDAGTIDRAGLEGVDAAVHLAGESIAGARWTRAHKARVRESRTRGTRLLAEALAALERPPRVLVAASAIGWYGDRGDTPVDESSAPGTGFLAEVAQAWEAATAPAAQAGVRVVNLRFGVVLTPAGGALHKLLLPFRLGVGGRMGNGRQWWSWIAIDDLLGAIQHALMTDALRGPVNATTPVPVTNAEFARVLARVLNRPALVPTPAFALRLLLGAEMANAMLLTGARVLPGRLLETGYRFRFPELESALRQVLGAAR